jgi:hypothetical protein
MFLVDHYRRDRAIIHSGNKQNYEGPGPEQVAEIDKARILRPLGGCSQGAFALRLRCENKKGTPDSPSITRSGYSFLFNVYASWVDHLFDRRKKLMIPQLSYRGIYQQDHLFIGEDRWIMRLSTCSRPTTPRLAAAAAASGNWNLKPGNLIPAKLIR